MKITQTVATTCTNTVRVAVCWLCYSITLVCVFQSGLMVVTDNNYSHLTAVCSGIPRWTSSTKSAPRPSQLTMPAHHCSLYKLTCTSFLSKILGCVSPA